MTTKEAIQAMLDGKKVRVKTQDAQEYIYISDDGYIVDENNELIGFTNSSNWEIYEEPKPKQTVVIEKWLCKSLTCGKEYFFEVSTNDIDSYFYDWNDSTTQKVKLLDTQEIELP